MMACRILARQSGVASLFGALLLALPASSTPIAFDFEVSIDAVVEVPGVELGDQLNGRISFETDTLPTFGGIDQNYAFYNPVGEIWVSVGPISILWEQAWIIVNNNLCGECSLPEDSIEFVPAISNFNTPWFTLKVAAPARLGQGPDFIDSTDLPLTPPDLSVAEWRNFFLNLGPGSSLGGSVESLTLAIPEPSSLLLILLGLGVIRFIPRPKSGP